MKKPTIVRTNDISDALASIVNIFISGPPMTFLVASGMSFDACSVSFTDFLNAFRAKPKGTITARNAIGQIIRLAPWFEIADMVQLTMKAA
ncbi:MAG: hypothetical protein H0U23_06640 [Blastocatellia bacterium]|nr:hypothetical protein [Blastocatellia bacterium]